MESQTTINTVFVLSTHGLDKKARRFRFENCAQIFWSMLRKG